jgi:hypothetical protein
MGGASGGISGKYAEEIKKVAEKMVCAFGKIRFITISANGKNIMESGKVTEEEHLRIKIQPDLGMKYIA